MADLLPCPFCGSSPAIREPEPTDGFAIHVRCRCGLELYGTAAHFADREAAVVAWNLRAAPVVDEAMARAFWEAYAPKDQEQSLDANIVPVMRGLYAALAQQPGEVDRG